MLKFQHKYIDAKVGSEYEFEYSYIIKTAELGRCSHCGSFTSWKFTAINKPVCSEECGGKLWGTWKNDPTFKDNLEKFDRFKKQVENELVLASEARCPWKDILVIVHNQLEYVKICVNSLRETTHNFNLYIWDNGSRSDTEGYFRQLMDEYSSLSNPDWNLEIIRTDTNVGFIGPNNDLAQIGSGEFIICLNSDTKVFPNWDRAMTGFLDANSDVAQVGFWGGHLDAEGRGFGGENGYDVDYIPGWCFCISRKTYDEFGLFSKQLKFAYCEDADLSLRLKEAGRKIYALHAPLVCHYQNKTIEEVHEKGEVDVEATFNHNHKYIQHRWKDYIERDRVLLRRKEAPNEMAQASQF